MSRKRIKTELNTPIEKLHKQGYNFISDNSSAAIKPCLWCKRSLRGGDQCYKHQFYGIESWRCVQMTPTLRCNQRCLFCWRSMEHEIITEEELDPDTIIQSIPRLQKKGLSGEKIQSDPEMWNMAVNHPSQYAISLAGEPTLYSKLPELIDKLRLDGSSVFVVSNGTVPDMVRRIRPTQLYISLDAADIETYVKLCRPIGDPYTMWNNIQESLSLLQEKERIDEINTAIRITLVKGYNDHNITNFSNIINQSLPKYIEIKGYMYLGYSRTRLSESSIPTMTDIRNFTMNILSHTTDYQILNENEPSKVICLKRV
ncbi:MAG TPA: 4-demethylwyosine synthase TYW1 [Methanocorpusculum sp.]|nr:4-demethylwyosine synthase TYW1 [Methanocorpusculum sp.]